MLGFRERVAADGRRGVGAWRLLDGRPAATEGLGRSRDGNGAPIPDPRRGFNPLGDLNGSNLLPVGSLTGQI